jgi:hypothetical protein
MKGPAKNSAKRAHAKRVAMPQGWRPWKITLLLVTVK